MDCGYLLESPRSNDNPQSMFRAEMWKKYQFFIWNFLIFGGEIFYILEYACFCNEFQNSGNAFFFFNYDFIKGCLSQFIS